MHCEHSHIEMGSLASRWDDDFIGLSGCLLEADSISTFVRSLNEFSIEFASLAVISLVIHDYPGRGNTVFSIDPNSLEILKISRENYDMPDHELDEREVINMMDGDIFGSVYPELTRLPPYRNLKQYCQFPLNAVNRHLGGIEFISHESEPFSELVLCKLKQYASIVATLIAPMLDRDRAKYESRRKQPENNAARLLVEVTNMVMSQGSVDGLVAGLHELLFRHFGIDHVALKYFSEKLNVFECYVLSANQPDKVHFEVEDASKGCEIELNVLHTSHPVTRKTALNGQVRGMGFLPLVFRNRCRGVVCLGHAGDYFSICDLSLLQRIVARVAMALHSIQVHQRTFSLQQENQVPIREQIHRHQVFDEVISQSEVMNTVLNQAAMVADCDCTVLILGETGTGKELIAKAIHALSHRSDNKMVKMNCSAVPAGLFESDLFGHEKGAFTGALNKRIGRFEQADKSTLFMDEIGDMPLDLQPKILRALQESEVERVGSYKLIPVDVRVVAATNCDLLKMVQEKTFRSDLYYRLNVFPIVLPPLRERREDIPLLVKHFTAQIADKMKREISSIPEDTMRILCAYDWPGNIRELRNVVERAVVLTRGHVLDVPLDDLMFSEATSRVSGTSEVRSVPERIPASEIPAPVSPQASEKERIIRVLKETNGVVGGPRGAAQMMGVKRTTLLSRMKRLGISPKGTSKSATAIKRIRTYDEIH
ncbi:sigma 54-interacting transcriptional regulator [Sansalvadorimonas verongulae]|uniref:sigma 54-interacting transcriptional regulator n=1 Tax=Sansalvadorimonas verongulae TaxID=2172824 RepID=UPI0012BB7860|nr:sigma 54-interacting transcriptional regulator [Sansalvadorimonas verongulae]MTI15368.1 hypothetical protein [Sansalvadorimonas verongulae]